MVNETQGPVADRSAEHLGTIDRVLVAMRGIYFQAMKDVQAGRDPKHIIRETERNVIVYIRGEDIFEHV